MSILRVVMASLAASFTLGAVNLPNPATDEKKPEAKSEVAVFAGGCFWGVEAIFDAVKGVSEAVSGYAGGSKNNTVYQSRGLLDKAARRLQTPVQRWVKFFCRFRCHIAAPD